MTRFLHEIHSNNEFGEERKWSEMKRLHCFSVSFVSEILLFALLFCGNWAVVRRNDDDDDDDTHFASYKMASCYFRINRFNMEYRPRRT